MVTEDEGIRPETTVERLAKLPPAFKADGTTTAGNSSQVSDGAAAVVLASRRAATALGLPVLAVLRSYAVCFLVKRNSLQHPVLHPFPF